MSAATGPGRIFPLATFISDLPHHLLPRRTDLPPREGSSSTATHRLLIVGDVHGMKRSLVALLDKAGFDRSKGDHLVLVGDVVNKGPDSAAVVDLAIKLGASAVRGNHDDAVLRAAAELKAGSDTVSHGEETRKTAAALSTSQLDWLASLPLMLRIQLPPRPRCSLGNVVVVHAGLVPGTPLEEQDAYAVMHMRSLVVLNDTLSPDEAAGEEGWAVEWDRRQHELASASREDETMTVIFGHDAKRSLQMGRYAIGLDSACVYGHRLTGLLLEPTESGLEHRIVQVEAADEQPPPPSPTVASV
ncbi:hypothetical protein RJ55_01517 [Drechmeria coniospora]|nr:hypothetical protein RJ55_01517 [Drechmeria coniospora]